MQNQKLENQVEETAPAEVVVTEPVKLVKKVDKLEAKMQAYISGLSKRALEVQIKSQERDGKGADKAYLKALEAELKKRK